MTSRLNELRGMGQAVWLDFVDRKFLADGGLRKLVGEDGLTGVTSNPSIFEKAMGHGDTYEAGFQSILGNADASVQDIYESQASDFPKTNGAGHGCNRSARWPTSGGHRPGCRTVPH